MTRDLQTITRPKDVIYTAFPVLWTAELPSDAVAALPFGAAAVATMSAAYPPPEMAAFTVGLIGMGDMGKMYAQRLSIAGWR